MLLHYLPHFSLQVVFGGTNIRTDLSKLRRRAPDILVATPGRLNDLLENHGLQRQMGALSVMVFDEADQLLEMGFRPAITQGLNSMEQGWDLIEPAAGLDSLVIGKKDRLLSKYNII